MPTLRFLVFKMAMLPDAFAHWALFVPNEEGSAEGVLFEVQKRGVFMRKTQFHYREFDCCASGAELRDNISIPEISVGLVMLNFACHAVTKNRPFHLRSRNCQHWVFEVIEYLVNAQRINNGQEILSRIVARGHSPLRYKGYTP